MKTLEKAPFISGNLVYSQKTKQRNVQSSTTTKGALGGLYYNILNEYGKTPYGYGIISILGQSCFASISALFILMNSNLSTFTQLFQLFFVTIFCIGFNAMVISQRTIRIQVNALFISVLTSMFFLVYNLI